MTALGMHPGVGSGSADDGICCRALSNPRSVSDDGGASDSLTGISEQLFHEFGPYIGLVEIVAVVRQCRSEVDVAPAASVPELVERRARERLRLAKAVLRSAESDAVR